jgi:hypothetical protein
MVHIPTPIPDILLFRVLVFNHGLADGIDQPAINTDFFRNSMRSMMFLRTYRNSILS